MRDDQNTGRYSARNRIFNPIVRLIALGFGAFCLAAHAETASKEEQKVQLYLAVAGGVPKKGYIEKDTTGAPAGGKVSFRECKTAKQSLIEKEQLRPITGTCAGAGPTWLGWIIAVSPDGKIELQMPGGKTMVLTKEGWQKGFANQPSNTVVKGPLPTPTVGEFVSGASHKEPRNFYLIENRPDQDIKG